MKPDVFISYRREGGIDFAGRLMDHLVAKGYSPFMDLESMHSGRFDTQIYQRIDECEHFILVLPQNALKRCRSAEDWVRKEVEFAIKRRKHIIPICLSGFVYPKRMPASMEVLRDIQSVTDSPGSFEKTVDRTVEYMMDNSWTPDEYDQSFEKAGRWVKRRRVKLFAAALLVLMLVGIGVWRVSRWFLMREVPDQTVVDWVTVNRNDII